jgi:nucleoside-triphosphatase THEP1
MRVWNSLKNLQSKYLCDEQDDIIVDYVGKFENLQNDFNHCCDRIGIEQLELIKHGATKHRSFEDIYTPAMREIVNAHSGKDIDRFEYASSLDDLPVT